MSTVRATPSSALLELVDELLEAHADTVDLAGGLIRDPDWDLHVRYLRGLQRAGREILADCDRENTW